MNSWRVIASPTPLGQCVDAPTLLASRATGRDAAVVNPAPPAGPEAFNAWDLTSLSSLPSWVFVVVAAALSLAVAWSWHSTQGAPNSTRLGLLALRASVALALLVLVCEPGRRLMATSREPDRVIVAVDASMSMSVGEGASQRARVAAKAARAVLDDLATREPPVTAELWFFDDETRVGTKDDLVAIESGARPPVGRETRLGLPVQRALDEGGVVDGSRGSPLGGMIVISDGADTSGLTPALTGELRERLAGLGRLPGGSDTAPLHTVVVGADASFRDIVIERVIADDFAFVRNPLTIEVILRHRGFTGITLPLSLAEDGVIIARADVVLGDDGEQRATMTFSPQQAGKHLYTVETPVIDGEAIAENNRLDFTMKLIRDRIRVLQVAGRPSWDERFVRRLLKENPSVDLISFFILRSPSDISGAGNNELSLIPFPTKELFTEQLHTFDVVIFQDFNYRPYGMGIYLQNVADYVRGGGGFLMMGGDLSFSEGDYEGTPLADVLPVRLLPGHGHVGVDDFQPVLTDIGRRHPITDVAGTIAGAADAATIFQSLPSLQGLNKTAGLVDGAAAVLTHPFENGPDGQPQPVIAVRDVGKGRSVAIMTDTTWHWSLPQVGQGTGRSDAHRKLLANTLRWLIRDPELSRVQLSLDADARGVEPGAEVEAEIRVQDALYQPEVGAAVTVRLVPLDGGARPAAGPPVSAEGVTGTDGVARLSVTPDRPGAWKVRAEVKKGGEIVGVDEDVFVVRRASLERLFAEARPEILAALAAAGGGRSVGPDDVVGLPLTHHGVVRVHRQKTDPIWNQWTVLVVVVGLAAVEWWWRRRRGFA
jgi:uncharacterized membrane protein